MIKKLALTVLILVAPFYSQASEMLVTCNGSGPSRDIAERLAIGQCIAMASDRINGSYHVQTLSVETEQAAAYHQEVSANRSVSGLVCDIKNEEVTEADETYKAKLTCSFDTSKTKIIDTTNAISMPQILTGNDRHLIISTIPQCGTIIVRGFMPRIVNCNSNITKILVHKTDKELIVRAGHFKPKHIQFSQVLGNTLEVYLERD